VHATTEEEDSEFAIQAEKGRRGEEIMRTENRKTAYDKSNFKTIPGPCKVTASAASASGTEIRHVKVITDAAAAALSAARFDGVSVCVHACDQVAFSMRL
jgi:hypothetical protein